MGIVSGLSKSTEHPSAVSTLRLEAVSGSTDRRIKVPVIRSSYRIPGNFFMFKAQRHLGLSCV